MIPRNAFVHVLSLWWCFGHPFSFPHSLDPNQNQGLNRDLEGLKDCNLIRILCTASGWQGGRSQTETGGCVSMLNCASGVDWLAHLLFRFYSAFGRLATRVKSELASSES